MTTPLTSMFPLNFFEHLQGASNTATLSALSAFSRQRNFGAMNAFISHAEQHGLGSLTSNVRSSVVIEDKDRKEVFVQDRFTQVLARTLAPSPCESQRLKDATMLSANHWSEQHQAFFNRCIGLVLRENKDNDLLSKFAFDMAGLVPHVPAMAQLLDLNVSASLKMPAEKGGAMTLAREAVLWGNLQVATLLVQKMSPSEAAALVDQMVLPTRENHASQKHGGSHPDALRIVKLYMDKDDASVSGTPVAERIHDFLHAVDEKVGAQAGAELRTLVLQRYLQTCTNTTTKAIWSHEALALIMGAQLGQSLGETVTAQFISAPTAKSCAIEESEVVLHALQAHCKDVLEACTPRIKRMLNDHCMCLDHAVSVESRTLVHERAHRSHGNERFRDTLCFMVSLGSSMNQTTKTSNSLLHTLAISGNSEDEDKLCKLAIALDLGADPSIKNRAGRTPSTTIPKGEARDRWDHVVHTHKARQASRKAIEEMDLALPSSQEKSRGASPGF